MDKNADERIMVKLTASDQFVIFRTFTRNRKRSRDFYVSREELLSLRTRGFLITRDSSFAVFQTDEGNDALKIDFGCTDFVNLNADQSRQDRRSIP